MEIDEAVRLVEPVLSEKRYQHTLRVAQTALKLANRYGVDARKAELAGVLHDYAKYWPVDEMKEMIQTSELPKDLLEFHHELWHAPVGAYLLETNSGVTDQAVLDAIRYHTTGRKGMADLELVVFLADYIEPGRSFPGLDEVRETAKVNLVKACQMAVQNTITFLMQKKSFIYPDTLHAYNELTARLNKGDE